MKITTYITALFLISIVASCTKVIDIKVADDTGKLVIEGNLTNVSGTQTIKISKNAALSNTNTYPPVTGATVVVTDETGNSIPFTESPSGSYSVNQLAGMAGNTYTMSVTTEGITYTAKSTMPALVSPDSLTSKTRTLNKDKKEITIHYQDPAGVANQYRFVMYVNGVQVKSIFTGDDRFNDGKYVNLDLNQSDIDIYAGDTVKVEMQCIDKTLYTYWYTLSQQNTNGPGGGVTPADPPTNISPSTLGYYSVHTTQVITITAK